MTEVPHRPTVLVLTPGTGGYYFGELLASLRREISRAGGRMVVVQTVPRHAPEDGLALSDFDSPVGWEHVAGAISVTTAAGAPYLQRLRELGKPVVLISGRVPGFAAPSAVPDNSGGVRAAVEHLLAHGHQRIGFVGNVGQPDIADRYAAYLRTLADLGRPAAAEDLIPAGDNDWSGGEQAARRLLARAERPTALVVATDRNAIGLIRTLTAGRVSVPGDVAVIGYDNVEQAAFSEPPLTTVDQRFAEVGALAARMVLRQLAGQPVEPGPHPAIR
ncbi:MAG TPA: substrate-binding domain-containing protein, partial [Jatrophihabitans sp.]|nr:substrate-binding domain-containing protein [Jatrophihabitans sp.]